MNNSIVINQTLHGYENGHHLIAASIELSEAAKRRMTILSDLSGSEIQTGFKEYFTGYHLPEDHKIVLGLTWYADEMERPGCVWTHSLIIDSKDMYEFGDYLCQLLQIFRRPNNEKGSQYYTKPIVLDNKMIDSKDILDSTKLTYLIWAIWGNDLPVIIPSYNSAFYANELMYFWLKYSILLDSNFSFSTGSLAVRKYEAGLLDLQVVPDSLISRISKQQSEYKVLHNKDEIKSFPFWVQKAFLMLKDDNWKDLICFIEQFGKKYLNRCYFAAFIKIYVGSKAELKNLSIAEGMNIIDKVFLEKERITISNKLITLSLDGKLGSWVDNDDNYLEVLQYVIMKDEFDIGEDKLLELIHLGIKEKESEIKKILHFLVNEGENKTRKTALRIIATTMPENKFEYFTNMDLKICGAIIRQNPIYVLNIGIWKNTKSFQEEIFEVLKNTENLPLSLINIVLDNSQYDFSSTLNNLYGEACVNIFLDYLLGQKLNPEKKYSVTNICCKYQHQCIARLVDKYRELENYQILILLEIIDQYSSTVLNKGKVLWIQIFGKFNPSFLTDKDKKILALFYLPIILSSNERYPQHIADFVYDKSYSLLEKQNVTSRDFTHLDELLPVDKFFNMWDKCRRLKKAFKQKGYNIKTKDDSDLDIHLL